MTNYMCKKQLNTYDQVLAIAAHLRKREARERAAVAEVAEASPFSRGGPDTIDSTMSEAVQAEVEPVEQPLEQPQRRAASADRSFVQSLAILLGQA